MINDLPQGPSDSRSERGSAGHVHSPQQPGGGTSNGSLITRLTRRLAATGAVLLLAAGLVTTAAPAASAADSTTYLEGVSRVADIVAEGGRLFISAVDRILIADGQGAVTGTIPGLSQVGGLAVTADGARLYATLSVSPEVIELDTGSLAIVRRFNLAGYECPSNLALSGHRLWVGYGCGTTSGGVLSLDLSVAEPQPARIPYSAIGSAPIVAAAGNTLVMGESGINPGRLRVYDVSGDSPTLRGVIEGSSIDAGFLEDLAITPDGAKVISAFWRPYQYDVWDTTTLTRVRTYDGPGATFAGSPNAVALSPDGAHIAGGRSVAGTSPRRPPVALYDVSTAEKVNTYDNPVGDLTAGNLVFSGSDLFGVLEGPAKRLYLWRIEDYVLPASSLTLTAPSTATALDEFTMTGRLTLNDGSSPGEQPLVVTRRLPDGSTQTLAGSTTEADGTFAITDTPPVGGTLAYDVLWDGNASFRWSSASATVTVAKRDTSLTLTAPSTATALDKFTMTGRLTRDDGSSPGEQPLVVTRQQGGTTQTLPNATTETDGTFTITDTPPVGGTATYEVRWAGNAAFRSSSASATVTVAKRQALLTLAGPKKGRLGQEIQFKGRLDLGGYTPTSRPQLQVERTVSNSDGTSTVTLSRVLTAPDGTFTFANTPYDEIGQYTYTVKWAGDGTSLPAEASWQITIRG